MQLLIQLSIKLMMLLVERSFILRALGWHLNLVVYGNQVPMIILSLAISDVTAVCRWFSETRRIVHKPPLRQRTTYLMGEISS